MGSHEGPGVEPSCEVPRIRLEPPIDGIRGAGFLFGPHTEACRKYLEGRLFQRRGDAEAAARFEELIRGGAVGVESYLRLAESLRQAGNAPAAEKHLLQALSGPEPESRDRTPSRSPSTTARSLSELAIHRTGTWRPRDRRGTRCPRR